MKRPPLWKVLVSAVMLPTGMAVVFFMIAAKGAAMVLEDAR